MPSKKDDTLQTLLIGLGAASLTTAAFFYAKRVRENTGKDFVIPAILLTGPIGTAVMSKLIK